jgi:ribosomal protein S18 acetylase RimI-like enzyme
MDRGCSVAGVAASFLGFQQPVLSLVCADSEAAGLLFEVARKALDPPLLLALHAAEPFAATCRPETRQIDVWMVRETTATEVAREIVGINDAQELLTFCDRQGLRFWAAPMLGFGHAFGIRVNGELVSAASVNFVLEEQSYAQVGSIATDPQHRRRGFATACIRAVVNSLNRAGIARCGLFADSKDQRLLAFYSKVEFRAAGEYHFVNVVRQNSEMERIGPALIDVRHHNLRP